MALNGERECFIRIASSNYQEKRKMLLHSKLRGMCLKIKISEIFSTSSISTNLYLFANTLVTQAYQI